MGLGSIHFVGFVVWLVSWYICALIYTVDSSCFEDLILSVRFDYFDVSFAISSI